MGCCQGLQEASEVDISNVYDRFKQECEEFDSSELISDLDRSQNSEVLDFHFGYTEIGKCAYSTRDSNYSAHIKQNKAALNPIL